MASCCFVSQFPPTGNKNSNDWNNSALMKLGHCSPAQRTSVRDTWDLKNWQKDSASSLVISSSFVLCLPLYLLLFSFGQLRNPPPLGVFMCFMTTSLWFLCTEGLCGAVPVFSSTVQQLAAPISPLWCSENSRMDQASFQVAVTSGYSLPIKALFCLSTSD